ncbi:unnamed protein product [Ilex paraguariensis]|uniref:VQ domain-containing protein n=1 Tax=Ilex paraguariensis TaxID=185542 RepID=A0ABC8UX23_9AQUA
MCFFPVSAHHLHPISAMASSNPNNNNVPSAPSSSVHVGYESNTTFVQADPSTFRDVVQRLTGATQDPSTQKLPVTVPARLSGKPTSGEMGPRRSTFKLHERRQSAIKLEIKLNNGGGNSVGFGGSTPTSARQRGLLRFGGEMFMVSPVSPLDLLGQGSPRTPRSPLEEEERAIAEKGFYLHPSPLSTPRASDPPELLPLFPISSPRDNSSSS